MIRLYDSLAIELACNFDGCTTYQEAIDRATEFMKQYKIPETFLIYKNEFIDLLII